MAARMGDLLPGGLLEKVDGRRGNCHNCSFSGSRGGCQQGRDESIKLVHVHVRATLWQPEWEISFWGIWRSRPHVFFGSCQAPPCLAGKLVESNLLRVR